MAHTAKIGKNHGYRAKAFGVIGRITAVSAGLFSETSPRGQENRIYGEQHVVRRSLRYNTLRYSTKKEKGCESGNLIPVQLNTKPDSGSGAFCSL